jgi:hypothetical protein
MEPRCAVYPRGYPHFVRHKRQTVREQRYDSAVRINAGWWLHEPDLDALTLLNGPVRSLEFCGTSIVLGDHTWSPINTQNTALHRSAIPSYYFLKMGFPVSGMRIDRYGDIFSGYFSQACAKSLGDSVRIGTPIATRPRNSHNYLQDATQELASICMLEELLLWLKEYRLTGRDYLEVYESLSHGLEEAPSRFHGFIWTPETAKFLRATALLMREWLKACRRIGA